MNSMLEQLEMDREQLADEVLNCYEQLNATFTVVTRVARCSTIKEALEMLVCELGRAVDSRFSYYIGQMGESESAEPSLGRSEHVYRAPTNASSDSDADFWRRHEAAIEAVIAKSRQCRVVTIGDDDKGEHDRDGCGHVMVLPMPMGGTKPTNNQWGSLVFVRADEQEPFAAVEMNLASSLVEMGSAVLDRIIYANRLSRGYLQTVSALVRTIEAKDPYTCGHSTRVATLACRLARMVGLPDENVRRLEWAGMLHDIGKIGISEQILCKAGPLTDEEFAEIKSHPGKSVNVLEPIEVLKPTLPIVKHHHEHFDGSGYPDGLAGEEIPLGARVLQIADVWDALTSDRSYRKAISSEKALEIMRREAGSVLDARLFGQFEEMLSGREGLS